MHVNHPRTDPANVAERRREVHDRHLPRAVGARRVLPARRDRGLLGRGLRAPPAGAPGGAERDWAHVQ
eukprot:2319171-Alexandrium_andersonii.AAC.1